MKHARRMGLAMVFTMALAIPSWARACPVCSRPAGRAVRAGIFDARFGANLLAASLPFAVCLGVAAAVRYGPKGGAGR